MSSENSTSVLIHDAHLRAESERVLEAANGLGRGLQPATSAAVRDLLRVVNGHYSNLIEGHHLHPVDVERALAGALSDDPERRDLQLEGVAHVEADRFVDRSVSDNPSRSVYDPAFIRQIHSEFYQRIPASLRIASRSASDGAESVVPGEYRQFDVNVGDHVAPHWTEVPQLMQWFAREHDPAQYFVDGHGGDRVGALLNAAVGHHRLLWIHPFGDGNGRVARLVTDAAMRAARADGNGLWSLTRGLANSRGEYFMRLADADRALQHDADGESGNWLASAERLVAFFLKTSAEQIAFMDAQLSTENLVDRVQRYCALRENIVVGPYSVPMSAAARKRGRPTGGFRTGTADVLRALVLEGEIGRSRVASVARASAPTASRLVRSLVKEGFAALDERTQRLRIRFPAHSLPYLFPSLVAGGG